MLYCLPKVATTEEVWAMFKFNNVVNELEIDEDKKKEKANEFVKEMSDRFLLLQIMEVGSMVLPAYCSKGVC